MWSFIFVCAFVFHSSLGLELVEAQFQAPVVITTWKFMNATERAWDILFNKRGSALDAVEKGCAVCEYEQCDFTVGFGGSPDEKGETTLDSMIMDGTTMNVGAVGGLRNIKNAVGVARRVLENTKHSFIVGQMATDFAKEMGFQEENLKTNYSRKIHEDWLKNGCQPNFRVGVIPDPKKSCGPYRPDFNSMPSDKRYFSFGEGNHDTIGMVAIDMNSEIASATSTNGAKHKIPGRVGDSPVAGAGSYADSDVGGAAATGDGDIMMRFLPSFFIVEEMKRGISPAKAAQNAINRIRVKYPDFVGAVIALRKDGVYGTACSGMDKFPYCVASPLTKKATRYFHKCK